MYRAVILDVDGTLVDSNDAHAHAWVDTLAEHGRHVEFSRVRWLIGMGGDKLLPSLTGIDAGSPEGEAIAARRAQIFEQRYIGTVKPTRGAQRLLERLADAGKDLIVASSAHEDELRDLLRIAGATKFISAVRSADGPGQSKPDPDIVLAAIARSGCEPQDVVMIGDTPYDVEAALRAGIGIIGLRSGGWSAEALKGALVVYADPEDLLDHYELSPFVRPLPVYP